MSDSLADGIGDPTQAQIRLYERWAEGGAAVSFIGEVQGGHGKETSCAPEHPLSVADHGLHGIQGDAAYYD